ncbi:hypothetical protein P389DRAFT_174849 [Cystobasidium minutum MCA 4210]|uniref:uncharacterized protein n=1 Tax=Cystobasidium minutum MCA 4210 TaxID=1397322 RepID=UPI0034CFF067|eukprot:jgi/Rhomi1/174849/fgenesh1_kg.8_\
MQQVSILDVSLKLVSIKRSALRSRMYEVVRCLAFKQELASQGRDDPFFSLTLNAVELSIFADASLVDKVFLSDRSVAGGLGSANAAQDIDESPEVEVSEDLWIALQVEGHEDDGETSGIRLRDISAPLAAAGISILFLSTYISDFLLIKRHRLELVISILERENFMSTDQDASPAARQISSEPPYFSPREDPQMLSTPSSSGGPNSLPSSLPAQLPRSLTRSASSLAQSVELSASQSRSSGVSPARAPSSQSSKDSRASSLSRSRPLLSELTSPVPESAGSNMLSPSFHSSVFEEQDQDITHENQPRSFEKMQESMLSDSSTASGIVDKITLLPDEVVCVGLSMQQEYLWRARIVHALFYPEDVLPPKPHQLALDDMQSPNALSASGTLEMSQDPDSRTTSRQAHLYSTTPTPQRPSMSFDTRITPARSFSASTNGSKSQSLFNATEDAEYPTPFLSLTITTEGGSLITDIRLLRALFADADESVVYAPGGGLHEMWSGEQDEDELSSGEGSEVGDYPNMETLSIDRGQSDESKDGRTGSWDVFDESADWEKVKPTSGFSGGDDEDEEQRRLFASGRRLFKALQLDLSSFGLEKAGLAHQFATLITKEKLNLLYSSTFRTANILVAKRHIRKARYALESASR